MSKNTAATPSTMQAYFDGAGIDLPEAEFFRVEAKWQSVRILAVRKPTLDDGEAYFETEGKRVRIWKRIEKTTLDGPDRLPVVVLVDVEHNGRPMVWEVSSTRLARAIMALPSVPPVDVRVKSVGEGTGRDFLVQVAGEVIVAEGDAPEKAAAKYPDCDAPGCIKAKGHPGGHQVKKVKA